MRKYDAISKNYWELEEDRFYSDAMFTTQTNQVCMDPYALTESDKEHTDYFFLRLFKHSLKVRTK
jgi:hypothetical protein